MSRFLKLKFLILNEIELFKSWNLDEITCKHYGLPKDCFIFGNLTIRSLNKK